MPAHLGQNQLLLTFIAVVLFILSSSICHAGEENPGRLETQYATIFYPNQDVLYEFGRNISRERPFMRRDVARTLKMTGANLDRITFRVKVLLDMYPKDLHYNVYVYATYREVKDVFRDIGMVKTAPVAFYLQNKRSIYLSVEALNGGVLAHEIAHVVINAYFPSPPPAKMQEILAQYVDRHLWD